MSSLNTHNTLSSACNTAVVTILWLLARSALADVTTVPGASCAAINPTQAKQMEFRESGVVNRDPNRDLWVICPLLRDASEDYAEPVYLAAAAIVFNDPKRTPPRPKFSVVSESSLQQTEYVVALRRSTFLHRNRPPFRYRDG